MFGFFFGQDTKSRSQRDQYRPSVVGKNAISPINRYGTCLACEGTGSRTLECKPCHGEGVHRGTCNGCRGTGVFTRPAKECFACSGKGKKGHLQCRRCDGAGVFKAAMSVACSRCNGSGAFASQCRKCHGRGAFSVKCKQCDGSGWYRFPG